MPRRIVRLLCGAVALICVGESNARQIWSWPDDKLSAHADLVVVARLVSTCDAGKEIAGTRDYDFLQPVLSTLNIVYVLKGEYADKRLVVVHNRLNLKGGQLINGPRLMKFNAKETYMVFLNRRSDGRYAPVVDFDSGQSMKPISQFTSSPAPVLDKQWSDLTAKNAVTVYRAICALQASPQKAVGLFEQHVKPVPHADANRLAETLRNLDSDSFKVRYRATMELEALGEAAEPALRRTLAGGPSEEVRQRLRRLLNRLGSVEAWRRSRAVEVLENIGDSESRRLLTALAQGAARARLTRQAQGALDRLNAGSEYSKK